MDDLDFVDRVGHVGHVGHVGPSRFSDNRLCDVCGLYSLCSLRDHHYSFFVSFVVVKSVGVGGVGSVVFCVGLDVETVFGQSPLVVLVTDCIVSTLFDDLWGCWGLSRCLSCCRLHSNS